MNPFGNFSSFSELALLLGLSVTRISVAFLLLPLLAAETVPATVRNSIFVALGIVTLALQPPLALAALDLGQLLALVAKEIFVGLAVGFFFGGVLWAVEAAGQIIDTKAGATMAQIIDPLSGHQTSPTGEFFGRLANFLFVSSGGLLLFVVVLLESFAVWPIAAALPDLRRAGDVVFALEFGRLMTIALLLAAPALAVLFLVDLALGLVNRYAQQLNVFALSLSIKAWLGTAIVTLLLASTIEFLLAQLLARPGVILRLLDSLLRP